MGAFSGRLVLLLITSLALVAPQGAGALPSGFPHIDVITPEQLVAGADDTTLVIKGSGFDPVLPSPIDGGSRVYADAPWSSASGWLETAIISDSEIHAVLPERFIEEEGSVSIAVYNGVGPEDLWIPTFWSNAKRLPVVAPDPEPGEVELILYVSPDQVANDCFGVDVSFSADEFGDPINVDATFNLSSDDLETAELDDGPVLFYDDWECDEAGRIDSITAEEGDWDLWFYARAPRPALVTITVGSDELESAATTEPIRVRGGWLSGRVTDKDGNPVQGVKVFLASEAVGAPGNGGFGVAVPGGFGYGGNGPCSYYPERSYARTVWSGADTPYLIGPVAVTGSDGRYLTESIGPGFMSVLFATPSSSNYASVWYGDVTDPVATNAIELRDRETLEGIDASVPAGGAISAVIRDAQSAPVDDVWVSVVDESTGRGLMRFPAADGETFMTPGLGAGTYRLQFAASESGHTSAWYPGVRHERDALGVTVLPGVITQITMDLVQGARLSGTVKGSGESADPIDAYVRVFDATSGTVVASAYTFVWDPTDVEPFLTNPGLPAGDYKIQVDPSDPGYVDTWHGGSSFADAATVSLATGEHLEIDLVADPGARFTGSVQQVSPLLLGLGLPKGAARYTAVLVQDAETGRLAGVGCSNSNGVFMTSAVDAGRYKIRFIPWGDYAPRWHGGSTEEDATVFEVERGTTTVVDALVQPGSVIAGTISSPAGSPKGQVYLELIESDTGRRLKSYSSQDGMFEFRGLPAGAFQVGAQDGSYWNDEEERFPNTWYPGAPTRSTAAEIAVGGMQEIDASFSFGTRSFIRGRVSGLTRFDRHATIEFLDPVDGTSVGSTGTSNDGSFVSDELHAGSYLVRMAGTWDRAPEFYGGSSTRVGATAVQVSPGAEMSGIDIVADPGWTVRGTTRAAFSAEAVGGVDVAIVDPATGDAVAYAGTDLDGNYRSSALGSGAYKLVFMPDAVFADQWYDRQDTFQTATVVELGSSDLTGIDALLNFS